MRYIAFVITLFIAGGAWGASFGYSTAGASDANYSAYTTVVTRFSPSLVQDAAIRFDSILVYCKSSSPFVDDTIKAVIYSYAPASANCSLKVTSTDKAALVGTTPSWHKLTMPSDTLAGFRTQYMVGVQTGIKATARLRYDAGSSGDTWYVGGSSWGAPTTLSGYTGSSYKISMVAYYTVVSSDTLVRINSSGADSSYWFDSYLYSGDGTGNYGTGAWEQFGHVSSDDFYVVARYDSMANLVPSGKKCDSAWLAFKIYTIEGVTKTDSLWLDTRRLLRNWVESEVTWNNYSTGNAWTTAGALSQGNDILSTTEEADSVCRCINQVGWSDTWDSSRCGVDDTLFIMVNPNTIDSMSSGDLSPYGWAIQYDGTKGSAVSARVWSRDRAAWASYDRPYLEIYCSDTVASGSPPAAVVVSSRYEPAGSGQRHGPSGSSSRYEP